MENGLANCHIVVDGFRARRNDIEMSQNKPDQKNLDALFDVAARTPAQAARGLIMVYRYSLSGLMGRQCRHLPSCSEYTHEAIGAYGLWAGGWMGLARICRCGPGGTSGIDNIPDALPAQSRWYMPWRYGRWRGVNGPPTSGEARPEDGG